ncbi:hypothetical protein [Aestuariivivens sediminis]|uniref:hypothetical protein n=1 Tax=Aestuariivivens sediminis TaxID=2913557 RepID=UPI001F58AF22|nr:hypothetical protein [Aestuariivivens sediminis]
MEKDRLYYLGLDMGRSSVKATSVRAKTGEKLLVLYKTMEEMPITTLQKDGGNKIQILGGPM